jgi:type II secretory ATPase GspE/PulE/Tfp pilus assembly ATPase PilB-like protein
MGISMTHAIMGLFAVSELPVFHSGTLSASLAPLASIPTGGYISIVKVIGMFVLVTPWLIAAPWVHRDSKTVRAPSGLWGSLALGIGAGGFVVWLLLPYYLAGLLLYVLAVLAVFISYFAYRNGRVSEDRRVSIASLFKRTVKEELERPLTKLRIYDSTTQIVIVPGENAPQDLIHAYNLAQDLLYEMVWRRASDVDLMPTGQQVRVRFVIDGVPISRPALSLADSEALVQYLKPLAGLSPDERRRPQKGQIAVDNVGTQVDIVLAMAGTTGGQRLQARVVQEFVQTNLDELGMNDEVRQEVRRLNQNTRGLFIVSGRPGSGITSTLFSLLREHDAFIKQLATLEAEASIDLENITHHSYGDPRRLSEQLASVLRRDPDVIMVDRCPDTETAQLICKAAQKKRVLLGMHAGDSFTALAKWVKVCGHPDPAMAVLDGVLCQMLLRMLCTKCREPYKPDRALLIKANIPADKIDVFFRPPTKPLTDEKGNVYTCSSCQGSGYFGRTAAFELLEITDELKRLVTTGASLVQIKSAARKRRMLYLQEQALRKVISRQTSVQEVIRVSQQKK